jgi:CO/xanthine dehydrogenase Mo-binding subunit
VGDAGAYASLSTKVLTRATTHATGPYQVPHARIDCYAMYTNNPPAGAFRGFGVTQSAFAVESNMDILAHELGMDPFELRRINALRVGSTTATGQVLRESAGLLDCLDWVESRVKSLPDPRPPTPVPRCSGLPGAWPAPTRTPAWEGARTTPRPPRSRSDGATADVEVRASSADLGQGLTTVVAQCAAEELGLPFDRVRVLLSDTDLCARRRARPRPAARPTSRATPPAWRRSDHAPAAGPRSGRAVGRSA